MPQKNSNDCNDEVVVMLTDMKIRQAKSKNKSYKLYDKGEGLYLLISSKSKRWYLRYSFAGKRFDKPLGKYPIVSLLEARKVTIEAKISLSNGVDPFGTASGDISFNDAFEVLFALDEQRLVESTMKNRRLRYEKYIKPTIGSLNLTDITPQNIMSIVLPLHDAGLEATAKRVRIIVGQVFRDGFSRYGLVYDPSQATQRLRKHKKTKHHPHIEDMELLGRLMLDIEKGRSSHSLTVQTAMRLLPYLFVRPHELRFAHGRDFNLDDQMWRRSPMGKMDRMHLIPLANQVVELLREWFELTACSNSYLFPSPTSESGVISDGTLNKYLKRLGYPGHIITPHGFRGTASTILYEQDYKEAWIERQLDHQEEKDTKASYDHSKYLKQRRKMMQDYADYLDELKKNAKVKH